MFKYKEKSGREIGNDGGLLIQNLIREMKMMIFPYSIFLIVVSSINVRFRNFAENFTGCLLESQNSQLKINNLSSYTTCLEVWN